jgi:membrane associated rhomboid family serine protease
MGPGLALAASGALVLRWLGAELDHWLFRPWNWSGGLVLAVVLALAQALSLGPLRRLRREWPLEQADAAEPRQAWRWITAPWIHHSHAEAAVNVLVLLLLLGPSPLPLPDVVLRYALTSLATTALALLLAQRRTSERRWDGASGAISALIGLAAGASLLHWRALGFLAGPIEIPSWVLLLVYGALQLGWQLPRQSEHDQSRPIDRLLSCQWWWGLVLGAAWAVISRLEGLLQLALRARDAAS